MVPFQVFTVMLGIMPSARFQNFPSGWKSAVLLKNATEICKRGLKSLKAAGLTDFTSSQDRGAELLHVHWLFIHGPRPMNKSFHSSLHGGATCPGCSSNLWIWGPNAHRLFSSPCFLFEFYTLIAALTCCLLPATNNTGFEIFFLDGRRVKKTN